MKTARFAIAVAISIAMLFPARGGMAAEAADHPLLAAIRSAQPQGRASAVDALWREVDAHGTPLVERIPGHEDRIRVTFLWRNAPSENDPNVALMASFLPGGSRELAPLARVAGTDVMAAGFTVDARARFRYYFAWPQGRASDPAAVWRMPVNGLTYELFDDARSRLFYIDDFDGAPVRTSYFEGPAAPAEPWLARSPAVAAGTLDTFEVHSRILNNDRRVSVYTPAGYSKGTGRYPVLVLFDREGYLLSAPTPTILDNLIAAGTVAPLVAVFVSAIDLAHREIELKPNDRFASFVVDELLPRVAADYRVTRDPRYRVVAGSSLGGLTSAHIAFQHPEAFGNVLSLSGSYWWHPAETEEGEEPVAVDAGGWLPRQYAARSRLPLHFYLSVGSGEGTRMLEPNRLFRDVLTAKGNVLRYGELQGDHSYLNWRDGLAAGLEFLLPGK
ncbi:MAG: alpha/beta hydrolase-fold protein [Gammaproteobacteria bacterium]